ncbi:RNA polymerase sigma factor FliA [Endozoicomonas arenosclerae]|uniref:RNA polymerase sigma factor FliA n=1 Tax=Endozoicomonas arenosclerae TaxID=1633495 RepID=UPI0007802FB1|nr:RNA polymerase sigma factor FliA [Endozoicomonas arenosclerae]
MPDSQPPTGSHPYSGSGQKLSGASALGGSGAMAYSQVQQLDVKELVHSHTGLVKKTALHLMGLTGSTVSLDDLIQSGLVGLLEAARRYDGRGLAGFRKFAQLRIHGAMIDQLRAIDGRPRSFREDSRDIRKAIKTLEGRLGRPPREREVAEELGVELHEYQQMLIEGNISHIVSLEDLIAGSDSVSYQQSSDQQEERGLNSSTLASALGHLSEREQLLLNLYYEHELNMKEVAQVLEITEARVCQLHRQALMQLKSILQAGKDKEV